MTHTAPSPFNGLGARGAQADEEPDDFARPSVQRTVDAASVEHGRSMTLNQFIARSEEIGLPRAAEELHAQLRQECQHDWVDATNEKVSGTELCLKCGALRPIQQGDVPVHIDHERMERALEGPHFTMPPGLTREQKVAYIEACARGEIQPEPVQQGHRKESGNGN